MKVKLKGISFFGAGDKEKKIIREFDGLVIHGELEDGRLTTQCIPWDNDIEVTAPGTMIASTSKKMIQEEECAFYGGGQKQKKVKK